MNRLVRFLMVIAVLAASLGAGCSGESPTSSSQGEQQLLAMSLLLPDGTIVDSANLLLYVPQAPTASINLHAGTAQWAESTVTWNSFAAAYDPVAATAFQAQDTGWLAVSITTTVRAWLDGTLPNYGLLMKYAMVDSILAASCVDSREAGATGPTLRLYCTLIDTVLVDTVADTVAVDTTRSEMMVMASGDVSIVQAMPDSNFGSNGLLCMENPSVEGPQVQSLVWFDLTIETDPGCTRGKGFWKNHAGFGPQEDLVSDLLPLTLGDGAKALVVSSADIAYGVLQQSQYGHPSNGITKLYAHLLTAKLNIASGASADAVADIVADADALLGQYDWNDWDQLDKETRNDVNMWKDMLESYNEGWIGPGHCDEYEGDDDGDDDDDESPISEARRTKVAASAAR